MQPDNESQELRLNLNGNVVIFRNPSGLAAYIAADPKHAEYIFNFIRDANLRAQQLEKEIEQLVKVQPDSRASLRLNFATYLRL